MASSEEQSAVNDNEEDLPEEERITITIDVSPTLYAKIEVAASEKALSISEYLERIVAESVSARGHPVTFEFIERLRRLREQIFQENNGQFFEDSVELLHQQREERTREQMTTHDVSSDEKGKRLTREKLEKVLKVREEIIRNTKGHTFDDSAELIRQMRDERSRELGEL